MALIKNLKIGQGYHKKALSSIINEPKVAGLQTGLLYCENQESTILFVTLDKKKKKEELHYNDYFEWDYFEWDSQNQQSFENKRIRSIYNNEVSVHLMVRVSDKLKGKTRPFIYCGELEYYSHNDGSKKPVHITFLCKDYEFDSHNYELNEVYNWKPSNIGSQITLVANKIKPITSKRKATYKKPNITERKGLITSRVGQGYYRKQVLEKWNYKCAITSLNITSILIASHIVPWKEANNEERLDPENGILLSPNYDSLFDRHLISFCENGNILISKTINLLELKKIGIDPLSKINVNDKMLPYLKRHRKLLK